MMTVNERVLFKKPKAKELLNQGFTPVDMHYHTRYSDGKATVASSVKKARKLGIGVNITDHNEIKGAIELSKYPDLFTIPGIEVTAREGMHLLYYFHSLDELQEFYNHNILPNKKKDIMFLDIGFSDLMDLSEDYNCTLGAPHPYGVAWTGVCAESHKDVVTEEKLKMFDSVEVINGASLRNMNEKALPLAESLGKGITGGSDGHRLSELGRVLTYTKFPATREEFLKSIKEKNNFVIGKETTFMQKLATNSMKITTPAKHPIIYAKQGINYVKGRMEEESEQ